MKKWNIILGVDVSKLTLDISCADRCLHLKIDNSQKGFSLFKKWCKQQALLLEEILVVMEHTGGYEYRFIQFCQSLSIDYCRVPGYQIKHSMGTTRGKDDKVDSYRIGLYGEEKIKRLKPSEPEQEHILKLKQLLSFRKRLVREKAGLQTTVKERKHMYAATTTDPIIRIALKKIKENRSYILLIEKEITQLIAAHQELLENFSILVSIKGIGAVNAWMTLAYTANFTRFTDARKYAVYIGVVPFSHTSGTSLKGKPHVSHIAHKGLKQELNQAAKTAMIHDPELGAYAARKLEKKCYALVLNNVKFKLILRMFSLVKRKEMYVENYKKTA